MIPMRDLLCAGVLSAALGALSLGCSSQHSIDQGQNTGLRPNVATTNQDGVGSVGVSLTIAQGLNVTSLSYTISNGSYSFSGTDPIGDAQSAEFVAGGIPAGSGYQINISGVDSNNDPCSGNATFNITAGATTYVVLSVVCITPTDATIPADVTTGAVAIEAGVSVVVDPPLQCPGITSLSASPAEIVDFVGQTSILAVSTTNPNATTSWTVSPTSVGGVAGGATIANPSAASTTLTCSAPGQYQVTVTLGLPDSGECGGLPYTSMSVLINCEDICMSGASFGSPCGPAGQICNGLGSCIVPTFSVVHVMASSSLPNAAEPVFIEQRGLNGALLGSISLPSAAFDGGSPEPFTLAGPGTPGTTEGDLNLSGDGRHLTLAGYQAPAAAANLLTSASGVPRVVASINAEGGVSTSLLPGSAFDGGNARSAVTVDGNEFWVSGTGGNSGVWYLHGGQAFPLPITGLPTGSSRWLRISSSQLYGSSSSTPPDLFQVGTGLPSTDAGVAVTELPGLPITDAGGVPSPYGFVLLNVAGTPTLYIADDRTTTGGGLEKWTFGGGTWAPSWSVLSPTALGFRGLAGYVSGSTVTLMASTGGASGVTLNSLVLIVDTGAGTPTPVVVATTAAGQGQFRGVAFSPYQ